MFFPKWESCWAGYVLTYSEIQDDVNTKRERNPANDIRLMELSLQWKNTPPHNYWQFIARMNKALDNTQMGSTHDSEGS